MKRLAITVRLNFTRAYSKRNKQLEKIVKENGLWDKVKESEKLKELTKKMIGGNYNRAKNKAANYISGQDAAGMLDLAHGKENYNELLKENITSIAFPKHGLIGILKNNNFKNALGKADVKIKEVDKQGNLHLKIFDTYDFNKETKDFLNKAGREEMLKGNLKGNFSIHDIVLTKDELDKIWN